MSKKCLIKKWYANTILWAYANKLKIVKIPETILVIVDSNCNVSSSLSFFALDCFSLLNFIIIVASKYYHLPLK